MEGDSGKAVEVVPCQAIACYQTCMGREES